MFLKTIPPIASRRVEAPITATLLGREERLQRSDDAEVVALVDVLDVARGRLDRKGDLERAVLQGARDAEAGVLENPEHRAVVADHLGDEPLDANRCSAPRELLEHARPHAAPLLVVGDGERDLGDLGVTETRVACESDDPVLERPDERAPLDPIGIDERLDEGRADGGDAVKSQIEAPLRERVEEADERVDVGGMRRAEPQRSAVAQDHVREAVDGEGGPGACWAPGPRGARNVLCQLASFCAVPVSFARCVWPNISAGAGLARGICTDA